MSEDVATPTYELKHKGFGRYEIVGHEDEGLFQTKGDAKARVEELKARDELERELGDIPPEGFKVADRVLMYRGTILELPMNEPYLPDGSHSPYYDRTWYWAWARHDQLDLSEKQAKGYRLVTEEEFEEGLKENKIPEHYRTFVRPEGSYLIYGDLVLIRMPRTLRRQRQAEKRQRALNRIKRTDEAGKSSLEKAGVPVAKSPIGNELTIKM